MGRSCGVLGCHLERSWVVESSGRLFTVFEFVAPGRWLGVATRWNSTLCSHHQCPQRENLGHIYFPGFVFSLFFFLGLTIKCTNLKCMVQLIFNEWISAKPPPWSKWRTFLAYLGPLPSQPHPQPKGNLYSNVYNHCLVLPVLKLYIIRTGAWMVLFVSEIDP